MTAASLASAHTHVHTRVSFKMPQWPGSMLPDWRGFVCYSSAPACSAALKTPSQRWRSGWICWKCPHSLFWGRDNPLVSPVSEMLQNSVLHLHRIHSTRTRPSVSLLETVRHSGAGAHHSSSLDAGSHSSPWSPHVYPIQHCGCAAIRVVVTRKLITM